jgi:hypothetical protein
LYILIFTFLVSRRETKASGLNGSNHYPIQSPLNFPMKHVACCLFLYR